MCRSSHFRSITLLIALGCAAIPTIKAQTFSATTGTEALITPTSAPRAATVNVPGHSRSSEEKLLFGRVRDGVYTVDGMVAKVHLNYDVNGVRFLTMFVPGLGTAVVSPAPVNDAVLSGATLKDGELSFEVGEHTFKLTGIALASNRGGVPAHLYVRLDRGAWQLGRQPMVGFGDVGAMPYQWPGALPSAPAPHTEETEVIPPVPARLLPSTTSIVPRVVAPANVEPASSNPVTNP